MFAQLKRESLRKLRMAEDKSPKGSIDEPIVDMIRLINDHPNYVTSSSCSGRIAVFCGVPATATAGEAGAEGGRDESVNLITKGGKWLLAEHATITWEQLSQALRSPDAISANSNMLIFKHEPFIMHVVCRDLDAAKELLQWGIACGFRESGVVLGNKKIMCAIRTSANGLEIPIAHSTKELLVSDEYLKWIVDIANEKFIANKKKTDQLFEAFKAKFYGEKPVVSNEAAVSSVEFDLYKELKCDEIKRVGHTSVAHGTSIVVFGGQGATASGTTSRLAALTIVSTAKDHSLEVIYKEDEKTAEAAPSARMQHSAVVVNNEMIVFGGRAGPTKPFNDVHAFKLDTRTWRAVDTVGGGPSPRYKHSCSVVGSTMYVYGGRDATTVLGDLFALDLGQSTPEWRQIDNPFTYPRFDHVSAVVEKTKVLFWGGMTSSRGVEDDGGDASEVTQKSVDNVLEASEKEQTYCLLFDTVTGIWERKELGNLSAGPEASLIAGSVCEVSDHHVVLSGGMTSSSLVNGDNATQKLFLLDAKTMKWMRLGEVKHANAAFAYHTCTWMPHNSSVYVLGGGFQCFGFGQFYSSPFQCELSLIKASILGAVKVTSSASAAVSSSENKSGRSTEASSQAMQSTDSSRPLGVLAAKLDVKKVKTLLEVAKVYDKSRRVHVIQRDDGSVFLIPVTASIHNAVTSNLELSSLDIVVDEDAYANKFGKSSGLNRNEVIQSTILAFAAKHHVPAPIQVTVPDKYEFVGDVLMVPRETFVEDEWKSFAQDMWAKVCASTSPAFSRVARKAFIDASEKRQSHVDLLYVNHSALTSSKANEAPGWVEVRENGIIYGWDITRVMFSSGNVTEKARMATIGCRNEVIVDLFCGIGYYVLPFLVHGGASFVHACEWNPDSVNALRFNLERNNVAHKCQVYLGDNRETAPKLADVADRVNLGLLPTSIKAWPLAVQVLKPSGGWFHVHDNVAVEDRDAWEQRLLAALRDLAQEHGKKWTITCEHVEKVKSYAPKVHHLVADIRCVPLDQQ
uniref:tRNA wybutosine-synthesizing protein 3 n=1 Tax=Globisporangium ultimum (strain ATCC 200006 / CBS 805.95 / DAOM BR144) TaxID=431595 RepID=K3WQA5_GLOUD